MNFNGLGAEGSKLPEAEKVEKLSREFESLFLEVVLKSMRSTIPKSELVDGGNAEDIYRNMLDSEYAKAMAENNHTGISQSIKAELMNKLTNRQDGQKVYAASGLKAGEKQGTIAPKEKEDVDGSAKTRS